MDHNSLTYCAIQNPMPEAKSCLSLHCRIGPCCNVQVCHVKPRPMILTWHKFKLQEAVRLSASPVESSNVLCEKGARDVALRSH